MVGTVAVLGAGVGATVVAVGLAPLLRRFTPGPDGAPDLPPALIWLSDRVRFHPTVMLAGLSLLVATVTAWRSQGPLLVPDVLLTVSLLLAAAVDVRTGRLPNALVLPSTALLVAALVVTEVRHPEAGSLTRALVVYLAAVVVLTVVALLLPRGLGMGDTRYLALAALGTSYPDLGRLVTMLVLLGVLNILFLLFLIRIGDPRRTLPLGVTAVMSCLGALWPPGLA